MILGVDVGGTFTDFCLLDDAGRVSSYKLLTSARDQSVPILQGIADAMSKQGTNSARLEKHPNGQ